MKGLGITEPLSPEDTPAVSSFHREITAYFDAMFIIDAVLVALGVLSNLFVCIVMSKSRHLKKTLSNCFIFHLALTDLVFRAVGIFRIVREISSKGEVSLKHCKTVVFIEYSCGAVVFLFLAGIALDRHAHIIHPFQLLGKKRRRSSAVVLVWFIGVVISVPFLLSATHLKIERKFRIANTEATALNKSENWTGASHEYIHKHQSPSCITGHPGAWPTMLSNTVYLVFAFLTPLLIMAVAYTRVLTYLGKRTRLKILNSAVARSKFKVIRMLLFVVLSFLLSWGPIMVLDLLQSCQILHSLELQVVTASGMSLPLRPLFQCLCKTSSILNPVIYSFGNSNFRRNARYLFCEKRNFMNLRGFY